MPEKEGTPLKTLGIEGCIPEEEGARIPCPWGPASDRTQEPSAAEMHPEETPKDSGHDSQPNSGECQGQPTADLDCAVRGTTTQQMDSLEETLRELEATLSQMGMTPTERPTGSPPPLPPSPQVAASSPVLPACLQVFRAGGSGGLQEHYTSLSSHWPSLSSCHLSGSLVPGRVDRQSPGRLGSQPPQGPAHLTLAGTRASPLCSVSINQQIKFSPLFPSPCPFPLSCLTFSVSVVSLPLPLELQSPSAQV